MEKSIYIVIPVFNRKEYTKACLLSLRKQTDTYFKTIIIDDGSTDGTANMLAEEFPEVDVITGSGNLWWTASVNLGIRKALTEGADYVLTLNNDVLAHEQFIENLRKHAATTPNALLGAFAFDAKNQQPCYGGALINWQKCSMTSLLDVLPQEQRQGLHRVTHFPGRGLLIPAAVFAKVGLFDEIEFPHYYADYDFTQRADRKGFPVYCNYDAILYTYPEESGDRNNRRKKTINNYYQHLFGIKGGGNLVNFTKYTFRHCPPHYVPSYLLQGYAKRIFGYLLK
ncbi:glycosyltransferase family 2 protein [Pontibacter vulgaris]|uniref:glycosyltransferase family 2 protein n=1 Tax=Pontibacter vulgaris TaxID=2905679 RepID=UPI001FA7BA65|nr:glycosyltransferase family 2 protein [Pontibacter vulgaris]